ncbi:MAG TPA: exosortase-associated EpsI family protein, partial [Spirochaetota bacterium]|nr:exosortase-associated EpsI family protein [Spirochaetota bacterium]
MMRSFTIRILVVLAVLAAAAYITYFSLGRLHEVSLRKPLADIPGIVGQWSETSQILLEDKIVGMLGVDEYVERVYVSQARENQQV